MYWLPAYIYIYICHLWKWYMLARYRGYCTKMKVLWCINFISLYQNSLMHKTSFVCTCNSSLMEEMTLYVCVWERERALEIYITLTLSKYKITAKIDCFDATFIHLVILFCLLFKTKKLPARSLKMMTNITKPTINQKNQMMTAITRLTINKKRTNHFLTNIHI